MPHYLLAHDLGTSADKATLFDSNGTLIASSEQSYPVSYCCSGLGVEQDANAWWDAFCRNNRAVLAGRNPRDVAAVAISGQMMACLPIDQDGIPLRPCMIWADRRSEAEAIYLQEKITARTYYTITGNCPSANYTAEKVLYLKRHEPDVWERAWKFLQPKDYINFLLTGRAATDPSDAGHTHIFDIFSHKWSETILSAIGLPLEKLPEVIDAGDPVGKVTHLAAQECGLPAGTLVVQGAGDGRAAMLGAGVLDSGDAYVSLGTSSWFTAATDHRNMDPDSGLYKGLSLKKGGYINGGTMQAGGLSYDWYLRRISGLLPSDTAEGCSKKAYEAAEALIQASQPGAGGVLFMPYILGERAPWFDHTANAAFLGLSQQSRREDLARSVMEGVALHLALIMKRAEKLDVVRSVRVIGGGAKSATWLQILADVFQKEILKPSVDVGAGSLGTAVLAGVGAGLYEDISVVKAFQHCTQRYEPRQEYAALYEELRLLLEDAYLSLQAVNRRLTNLRQNGEGI